MTCQKALFAAIAQNCGREGLHILTACTPLVHEGGAAGHITVGGADYDLRNALAIASDGVHRRPSRALSVASRAGVSLKTRGKCGLGHLRLATDGPGPGERQRRRGHELGLNPSAARGTRPRAGRCCPTPRARARKRSCLSCSRHQCRTARVPCRFFVMRQLQVPERLNRQGPKTGERPA